MNEAISLNVDSAKQIYRLLNTLDNLRKAAASCLDTVVVEGGRSKPVWPRLDDTTRQELEFWVGMAQDALKEIGYHND